MNAMKIRVSLRQLVLATPLPVIRLASRPAPPGVAEPEFAKRNAPVAHSNVAKSLARSLARGVSWSQILLMQFRVSYQFHHITFMTQSTNMMRRHRQETGNPTTAGKVPPHPPRYENQNPLWFSYRVRLNIRCSALFYGLGPSSAAAGACACNPCR